MYVCFVCSLSMFYIFCVCFLSFVCMFCTCEDSFFCDLALRWKDIANIFCTQSCSGLEANILPSEWFTRYSFQEFADSKLKHTKHTNLTYIQNIQNVCKNTKHRKIAVWKSVRLPTRMYFVILPVTKQYTKNRQRNSWFERVA